jgi:hypothetical protein
MFHKFINSIRSLGHHSTGFELYLSGLNRHRMGGGPTADEAKKDYRRAVHSENAGFLG